MTQDQDEALRAMRLAARLAQHPELRARFEEILALAENERGEANTADEAEELAVEQVRRLGQELMQSWAERKHARLVQEYDTRRDTRRKGKKKLYWLTRFGVVSLREQIYQQRRRNQQVRPFARAAHVQCRSLSLGLQRAVVDFGAATSFSAAVTKVREHYGVAVSASAVRAVTEGHGAAMCLEPEVSVHLPREGVRELLAEIDGTLVSVVEIGEAQGDKRKQRKCCWHEARLCLAGPAQSVRRRYAATMGSVEQAGRHWKACVAEAGAGQRTRLHGVGDGARWIVGQVREQFGERATFLVDFYHLSEYLGAAAQAIAGHGAKSWLWQQQARVKANQSAAVLAELAPHREAESVAEVSAPVRRCARYIQARLEYLDYAGAIERGWPIGSGEIESGHRSVVQARLKLSGAWWRAENAEKILALRVTRANGEWQSYWRGLRQAHA